jgi:hypothetical protein
MRTNIALDGELVREATRHIGNVSEGKLVRYPAWHSTRRITLEMPKRLHRVSLRLMQ